MGKKLTGKYLQTANETAQKMLDEGFSEQEITDFSKDYLNKFGVDEVLDVQTETVKKKETTTPTTPLQPKTEYPLASGLSSGSIPQSPTQSTPTVQSNGTSQGKPNWYDKYIPEEYRTPEVLAKVKNIARTSSPSEALNKINQLKGDIDVSTGKIKTKNVDKVISDNKKLIVNKNYDFNEQVNQNYDQLSTQVKEGNIQNGYNGITPEQNTEIKKLSYEGALQSEAGQRRQSVFDTETQIEQQVSNDIDRFGKFIQKTTIAPNVKEWLLENKNTAKDLVVSPTSHPTFLKEYTKIYKTDIERQREIELDKLSKSTPFSEKFSELDQAIRPEYQAKINEINNKYNESISKYQTKLSPLAKIKASTIVLQEGLANKKMPDVSKIGSMVLESLGVPEYEKAERLKSEGVGLTPDQKIATEKVGNEALKDFVSVYKPSADEGNPASKKLVALANHLIKTNDEILKDNPEFVNKQVSEAISNEIANNPKEYYGVTINGIPTVGVQQTFGLYDINDEMIAKAGKKLGIPQEYYSRITDKDIKSGNILGSFTSGAIGETALGIGGLSERLSNLSKGYSLETSNELANRWEDKAGFWKGLYNPASASNIQEDATIVDLDKTSDTYLQNIKNPDAGSWNLNISTVLDKMFYGGGMILGLGKGGSSMGKLMQSARLLNTEAGLINKAEKALELGYKAESAIDRAKYGTEATELLAKSGKASELADQLGMFTYGYMSGFDRNYRTGLTQFEGQPNADKKALVYAGMYSFIENAVEQMGFSEVKFVRGLSKTGTQRMTDLVERITSEGINSFDKKTLKENLISVIKSGIKVGGDITAEVAEEISTNIGDVMIKMLTGANKDPNADFLKDQWNTAVHTVIQMALTTGLGEIRQKSPMRENVQYQVALQPEAVRQAIKEQEKAGKINTATAIERMKTVNTLVELNNEIPQQDPISGKVLSTKEKIQYLNEGLKERLANHALEKTTDEVQKKRYEQIIKEAQESKIKILEMPTLEEQGNAIDNPTTPQGISVVEQNGKFTVKNPNGNDETFDTKEEADARVVEISNNATPNAEIVTPISEFESKKDELLKIRDEKINQLEKKENRPKILGVTAPNWLTNKSELVKRYNKEYEDDLVSLKNQFDEEKNKTQNNATQNIETTSTESTATIGQNELPQKETTVTEDVTTTEIEQPKPISAKLDGKDVTIEKTESGYTYTRPNGFEIEVTEDEHLQNIKDKSVIVNAEVGSKEATPTTSESGSPTTETAPKLSEKSGEIVTVNVGGKAITGTVEVDEGGKVSITSGNKTFELANDYPYADYASPVRVSDNGEGITVNGETYVEQRFETDAEGNEKVVLIKEDGTITTNTNPTIIEEIKYQTALQIMDEMSDEEAEQILKKHESKRPTKETTKEGVSKTDTGTSEKSEQEIRLQEAIEEIDLIENIALEELQNTETKAKLVEHENGKTYLVKKNDNGTFTATYNGRNVRKGNFLNNLIRQYEAQTKAESNALIPKLQEQVNNLKSEVEAKLFSIPLNIKENAIQEQTANEGLLRTEQPEMGLQGVDEGNEKPESTTTESKTKEETTLETFFNGAGEDLGVSMMQADIDKKGKSIINNIDKASPQQIDKIKSAFEKLKKANPKKELSLVEADNKITISAKEETVTPVSESSVEENLRNIAVAYDDAEIKRVMSIPILSIIKEVNDISGKNPMTKIGSLNQAYANRLKAELKSKGITVNDQTKLVDIKKEVDKLYRPKSTPVSESKPALRDVESTAKVIEDSDKWYKADKVVKDKDGNNITLTIDKNKDDNHFYIKARDIKGKEIGSALFETSNGKVWSGNEIEVNEGNRRKGIMTAMYDFAESEGHQLEPTKSLSKEGKAFWGNRNSESLLSKETPTTNEGTTTKGEPEIPIKGTIRLTPPYEHSKKTKEDFVELPRVLIRFGEPMKDDNGNVIGSFAYSGSKRGGQQEGVSVFEAGYDKESGMFIINSGNEQLGLSLQEAVSQKRKIYLVDGKELNIEGEDGENQIKPSTYKSVKEIDYDDIAEDASGDYEYTLADNPIRRNWWERSETKGEPNPTIQPTTSTEGKAESNDKAKLNEVIAKVDELVNNATDVVNVPISEIKINEKEYQGRKNSFSERSANNVAKNFDKNKFDPIIVYKHSDGNTYVLSGHSRLEGMKRRSENTIPARYFEGTDAEAKDFALKSNKLGTLQTDLENADYYRGKLKSGSSYNAVLVEAKENEQEGSAVRIIDYAHLNPKGKAYQALESLEKGESDTSTNVKLIAQKVGRIRSQNEHLTDAHEQELFDYFSENGYPTDKEIQDPNGTINRSINAVRFDPKEPLNLNKFVAKTAERIEWEKELKELETLRDELKKEVNPSKQSGWSGLKEKVIASLAKGKSKEQIDQAEKDFNSNKDNVKTNYEKKLAEQKQKLQGVNDKIAKHLLREKSLIQGEKNQGSLFSTSKPKKSITKEAFTALTNMLRKAFPKISFYTREEAEKILSDKGIEVNEMQTSSGDVFGFEYNGKIFLDETLMNADTPIHEVVGHYGINIIDAQSRGGDAKATAVMLKGFALLKEPEGKAVLDEVQANPAYANLPLRKQKLEAVATIIGREGAGIFEEGTKGAKQGNTFQSKVKAFINSFYEYIKSKLPTLKDKSIEDIGKMDNKEFIRAIIGDAFRGEIVADNTPSEGINLSSEPNANSPISDKNKKVIEGLVQDIKEGKRTEQEVRDLINDNPKSWVDKFTPYLDLQLSQLNDTEYQKALAKYDEIKSIKSEKVRKNELLKIINDNFDTITETLIKNNKIKRIC